MRIDILTLFPEVFDPYLDHGIVGRALNRRLVDIQCINFREFARDQHRSVDDRPFGGGPGMVLMCGPVFEAVEFAEKETGPAHRILLTPQGEPLNQNVVKDLASRSHLLLICGHYEGFDERIRAGLGCREISIGDYVLSGGEPAAMVLIDAVVRLLPGALGDEQSSVDESFSGGKLEYPHYTRPREFRGMAVPDVLLSGHHRQIAAWRMEQSVMRTRERRPDLFDGNADSRRAIV